MCVVAFLHSKLIFVLHLHNCALPCRCRTLQRRQRKEAAATLKAQQREQAARAFRVASERKKAVLEVVRRVRAIHTLVHAWEIGV